MGWDIIEELQRVFVMCFDHEQCAGILGMGCLNQLSRTFVYGFRRALNTNKNRLSLEILVEYRVDPAISLDGRERNPMQESQYLVICVSVRVPPGS